MPRAQKKPAQTRRKGSSTSNQASILPKLLSLIPTEALVLVAGGIRSGKSCLAYGLLDSLHALHPSRSILAFGFPESKAYLLPSWITITYDLEFPEGAIVIVDEAYIAFYSRESQSGPNKFIDTFSGLVGQKGILLLYVTQATRKLDIGLVSGSQVVLIKRPDVMQVKLDRAELRPILRTALEGFRRHSRDYQKHTYVISQSFEGMMLKTNSPPAFWTEELSKSWKGVALTKAGPVKSMLEGSECMECTEPAVALCKCHGSSYCKEHLEKHEA